MRRPLSELAPQTIRQYRSRLRKIWLQIQAGNAPESVHCELIELEGLLGVRGSEIPGPGRPRKWAAQ
jgi:hypothetical protein